MNTAFATLYENIIYNQDYSALFNHLFDLYKYADFGLTMLIVPIIFLVLFYFVWRNPYGKKWHYFTWLLISSVLVFGITYYIVFIATINSGSPQILNLLSNSSNGFESFAYQYFIKISLLNSALSFVFGFLLSLGMKRFSTLQTHLPF